LSHFAIGFCAHFAIGFCAVGKLLRFYQELQNFDSQRSFFPNARPTNQISHFIGVDSTIESVASS